MNLKENHSYKISLKVGDAILTYTCEIIEDDGTFFTFLDKFGEKLTYNKNLIMSIKEAGE